MISSYEVSLPKLEREQEEPAEIASPPKGQDGEPFLVEKEMAVEESVCEVFDRTGDQQRTVIIVVLRASGLNFLPTEIDSPLCTSNSDNCLLKKLR